MRIHDNGASAPATRNEATSRVDDKSSSATRPAGSAPSSDHLTLSSDAETLRAALDQAHVRPRFTLAWNYPSSATPERTYTLPNRENPEFIRFVNPSDYRVAREACGACHLPVIQAAERSLMATGAM